MLLYMNDVWEILFTIVIFRAVRTTNMANIGSYFLLLVKYKIFSKSCGQINSYMVGSTNGKLCIKFPQNTVAGEQHMLRPLNL